MLALTALQTLEIRITEETLRLLVLLALTVAIAFFVATELALVSASKEKIYRLSQEETDPKKRKAAERVNTAQNQIERYLSITQTGTTAGSLLLGWLGEGATVHWIEPWIRRLPFGHLSAMLTAHSVSVIVAFLLVTYVEIVLGELVPKVLAANAPEQTAMLLIRPLQIFFLHIFANSYIAQWHRVATHLAVDSPKSPIEQLPDFNPTIVRSDPHSVVLTGVTELNEINRRLGLNLPTNSAYTTIAGFMIHQLGRVPKQGERLNWHELELEASYVTEERLETIVLRQVTHPLVELTSEAALVTE